MRILLAENQSHVRWALRTVIGTQPGLMVVGEVERGDNLLDLAQALQPDLVLLDWELSGPPASRLLPALRATGALMGIIVLSTDPDVRATALSAGADAFVCKTEPPERLLSTLRRFRHRPVPAGEGDVLPYELI